MRWIFLFLLFPLTHLSAQESPYWQQLTYRYCTPNSLDCHEAVIDLDGRFGRDLQSELRFYRLRGADTTVLFTFEAAHALESVRIQEPTGALLNWDGAVGVAFVRYNDGMDSDDLYILADSKEGFSVVRVELVADVYENNIELLTVDVSKATQAHLDYLRGNDGYGPRYHELIPHEYLYLDDEVGIRIQNAYERKFKEARVGE